MAASAPSLEMRLFSQKGIQQKLCEAGFQAPFFQAVPVSRFGIAFLGAWLIPLVARKCGFHVRQTDGRPVYPRVSGQDSRVGGVATAIPGCSVEARSAAGKSSACIAMIPRHAGGGHGGHPLSANFKVRVVNHNHPITRGVSDFVVTDEQHFMKYQKDPKPSAAGERQLKTARRTRTWAPRRRRVGPTITANAGSVSWRRDTC
jgi:hypothetical protein